MKRNVLLNALLCFSLVLALTAGLTGSASAQSYYFKVDSLKVDVIIQQNGTMSIDYTYVFTNTASGAAIEYVDIGTPTTQYTLSKITADINGKAISHIKKSSQISVGIEVGLGSNAIQPGKKGIVHVNIGEVKSVLFKYTGTDRPDYVSFNFMPNYFGSQYVTGSTDMTLTIRYPQGIQESEPVFYAPQGWPSGDVSPEVGVDENDRVYYTWHSASASSSGQYTFGGAFPARYVPADAVLEKPDAALFTSNDNSSFSFDFETLFGMGCCAIFPLFMIWSVYESVVGSRKRRMQYLPPKISVEGHGIKRGLTAVQAAVIMEQPVEKIFTMILFGVIKKNAVSVTTREPLTIEALVPMPTGLYPYETEFIQAMTTLDPKERKTALQKVFVGLISTTTEQMKGFSLKETVAYYKDIQARAWAQVESAGTPEVKSQKFDETLEWTMLDKNFDDRTRTVFTGGPVFIPTWWGRYDPVYRHSHPAPIMSYGPGASSSSSGSAGGGSFAMPNLPGSDFAAGVVNGITGFSAGVLGGDPGAFTSGITNVTNPIPVTRSSGRSGGGGGRSCACACACAGCACACAGGGR